MEVKTGFADVNGTRLYYELAGSGDPMVLIHGRLGDRRHFDAQLEDFAERHKVLRYDLRGHGKSSPPIEGKPYRHVDDLKALLQHVGIPRAHIAGLCTGSAIAVDFALTYPEMSSSLISIAPWLNGYRDLEKYLDEISSLLKEGGAKNVAEHWWVNYPQMQKMLLEHSYWHFSHEDPVRLIDPPAFQQLDRIKSPTLLVTAEFDVKDCREAADLMEKEMPNATKVVIPDATHLMLMDKPKEFNGIVLDFLSEIGGR